MDRLLQKVRDLFCFCGLTKEEYRSIKKEAYISNFSVWKYLHVCFLIGYVLVALMLPPDNYISSSGILTLAGILYFTVASLLFFFLLKKEWLLSQFVIYLSMIVLLFSALMLNVRHPEPFVSFLFLILLVMLPMFMIDKPYFMTILLVCSVGVYLFAMHGVKAPADFRHDVIYAVFFGLFGIVINTFYNGIRAREFILAGREKEYVAEANATAENTGKLNAALKKMSESVLELLGDVVEERDADSGEHICRVKGFAYLLARCVMIDLPEYHLDDYTVDLITFTSSLHDVGKISIPDAILCKPGRLTKEEFEIMKTHCEKGCAIIGKMKDKWSRDYIDMGLSICLNHHEKWDGRGYPRGLKGDEIPIEAQIVSLADIFDALTSPRVYKEAYSYETAKQMILGGECGAFSDKMLACFVKCFDSFVEHAENPDLLDFGNRDYEFVSKSNPDESFVIGLHSDDRTLREKIRLDEEVAVLESLSETFCYVCYVKMLTNEVVRFKADSQFSRILDSYGSDMPSNKRLDTLLNSIIVAEDYDEFRRETERNRATLILSETGHMTLDFRIRLEDGVHFCRMRISRDPLHEDAVIIGISKRDEEHRMEAEYLNLQKELKITRREMESREILADRLAVIDCVSSEYDYVCSLNADTMDVVVYRAEEWIRDMFKNLEDIVVSPEVRNETLKGIILDEDFEQFQAGSRHEAVMKGLAGQGGVYCVNYRAFKYGQLVRYQTRYTLDKNNPKRIIIGLRSLGSAVAGKENA